MHCAVLFHASNNFSAIPGASCSYEDPISSVVISTLEKAREGKSSQFDSIVSIDYIRCSYKLCQLVKDLM